MNKDFCNSVITIPQITGTCWFNALMMMIFYSQNSRKLLLHYKPFNGKTDILSKTLKSLIYKNYKLDIETIHFFTKNTINSILSKFNLEQNIIDIISTKGYFIPFFIPKLFEGIDVNYLTLDFFNTYLYSPSTPGPPQIKNFYFGLSETVSRFIDNRGKDTYRTFLIDSNKRQRYKDFIKNKVENTVPLYLIINLWCSNKFLYNYFNSHQILNDFNISNGYNFNANGINELLNEITFNGRTYVLDSLSLGNYNDMKLQLAHAIAGITCKNNKYVYNGWIRNTNDAAMKTGINRTLPCELMPFEWDINKNNEFCINKNKCDLKGFIDNTNDLCFSFNKGNRTLIYVLKNDEYKSLDYNKSPLSKSSSYKIDKSKEIKKNIDKIDKIDKIDNDDKKCPDDKIYNPETKRCVLKSGKIGKMLLIKNDGNKKEIKIKKTDKKDDKKCSDDKIYNPETKRCVLKSGKIGKLLLIKK